MMSTERAYPLRGRLGSNGARRFVLFTPISGHHQPGPVGPKGAKMRHGVLKWRPMRGNRMRLIQLDAKGWKSQLDFIPSLTRALGSCEGHGMSPDAFVDSMIWGGMNRVEPRYTVQISNLNAAPKEVADYVSL